MKKKSKLSLLLVLLLLVEALCPFSAIADASGAGTFAIVSYEANGFVCSGDMLVTVGMANSALILNEDGTGTLLISGTPVEVTWFEGTLLVSGVPTYTFTRPDEDTVTVNMFGVMDYTFVRSDAAAAAVSAPELTPEPTAEPTPEPTAKPTAEPTPQGYTLSFKCETDMCTATVYRSETGEKDGAWATVCTLSDGSSFTDTQPCSGGKYYRISQQKSDGTSVDYYYANGSLKEKWAFNEKGKITSGTDYTNEISYSYVYENNSYKYRQKKLSLKNRPDYVKQDDETTKIGTATTYAFTIAEKATDCMSISFDFTLSQVVSGRPFGTWRLYVRIAKGKKWKEAATFNVPDGETVSVTKKLKNPMTIDKIAFIGPNRSYNCMTSVTVNALTLKDISY